jgi:hypothetical protein
MLVNITETNGRLELLADIAAGVVKTLRMPDEHLLKIERHMVSTVNVTSTFLCIHVQTTTDEFVWNAS